VSQVKPRDLDNELKQPFVNKLLRYAKDNYISKGVEYHDMLDDMAQRFNFPKEWLSKALGSDSALRGPLNEAYLRARSKSFATQQAKREAEWVNKPSVPKGVRFLWDLERSLKTLWHGPVFPFTHMIDLAKMPGKMSKFWVTEARAWAAASKNFHRETLDAMTSHPRYGFWRRMGAVIDPDRGPIGILGRRGSTWAARAWDMMKPARLELMDSELFDQNGNIRPKYAEMHKTDFEEMAKNVARRWNHITGAVSPDESTFGQLSEFMFAPELTSAKWHDFANDHARAMAMASKGPKNWTKGDKQFMGLVLRTDASRIAGHAAILAVNQGLLQSGLLTIPGEKKQVLNYTNPLKADWLRPKAFGQVYNMRGIDEVLQLVGKLAAVSKTATPEQLRRYVGVAPWETTPSRTEAAEKVITDYAKAKLHPSAEQVLSLGITHEDYFGRPLPSTKKLTGVELGGTPFTDPYRKKSRPQLTRLEYGGQVLTPIFVAGGLKEFYDGLREHGLSAMMSMKIIRPIVTAAEEFTGVSLYNESPQAIGKKP
jgi:hypothetical protein